MLVVTLAIVTVAMVLMNRFLGALRPACTNTVVETVASPDDAWHAVLFERSCGATSGFTSQVSVLPSGRALPDLSGNALVTMNGDTASSTEWGGPLVEVHWTDLRHVEITYDSTAHVMSQQRSVGEIGISFVKEPGDP